MTHPVVLAVASDRLPAVIGFVFLAVIVLSVVALVVATVAGTRSAGRAEKAMTALTDRVATLEERLARLEDAPAGGAAQAAGAPRTLPEVRSHMEPPT